MKNEYKIGDRIHYFMHVGKGRMLKFQGTVLDLMRTKARVQVDMQGRQTMMNVAYTSIEKVRAISEDADDKFLLHRQR